MIARSSRRYPSPAVYSLICGNSAVRQPNWAAIAPMALTTAGVAESTPDHVLASGASFAPSAVKAGPLDEQ